MSDLSRRTVRVIVGVLAMVLFSGCVQSPMTPAHDSAAYSSFNSYERMELDEFRSLRDARGVEPRPVETLPVAARTGPQF
jgi:hypothetical protein